MRIRAILATVAGLLILGCGDDSATGPPEPQPQPGVLEVSVASGTPVGALVFTVTGSGISSPAAVAGARLYHDQSGNTLRAVVVGSSLSGEIMRFTVPDVRQVAGYQVSVQQASGTANQSLPTGGITLSVAE